MSRVHLIVPLFTAGLTGADDALAQTSKLLLDLPYPAGKSFRCSQGNYGSFSHSDDVSAFAFDFGLPEGTPVLAAASGRVLFAVDEFDAGGLEDRFKHRSNLVWIDHGGGRLTFYDHLQPDSVRVVPGQLVNAGQELARSGNTGFSAGPHLHFAVTNLDRCSIPCSFRDVAGNGIPIEGRSYESGNDGVGTTWFTADSILPADTFASEGLVIDARLPAVFWNWDAVYSFIGRVAGTSTSAKFFVTHLDEQESIAGRSISISDDRSFEALLRLSDFADRFQPDAVVQYGFSPVSPDGTFHCKQMIPVVVWRDFVDPSGKVFTPLRLPLPAGGTYEYEIDERGSDGGVAVFLRLPDKTRVLASAAGRVIVCDPKLEMTSASDPNRRLTGSVRIDHGDGVTTECTGLDWPSLTVRAGEIVRGGQPIGLVQSAPREGEVLFAFRVRAGESARGVRFCELGATGAFTARGEAAASDVGADRHVFRADSRAAAVAFAANGIHDLVGAPAFTYHVGTAYELRGTVPESTTNVAFLVREGGRKPHRVVATTPAIQCTFRFGVQLGDGLKGLGSAGHEWCVAADGIDPTIWLPLTPMY